MQRELHTAVGVRDIYGQELKRKRNIMGRISSVFDKYYYEEIETPAIEYFDVFGSEIGTTPSNELYKFFDRDGNTLVLRPDFTPSVARAVSMYFSNIKDPVRLWYQGSTYVNHSEYQGRFNESTQMGVELIGQESEEADAEIIALTIEAIKAAGIEDFQVSIGEVEFFKSLALESGIDEKKVEEIRGQISRKNFFGVEELIGEIDMPSYIKEAFINLPKLFGGPEVLDEALKYAGSDVAKESIERLRKIYSIISKKGLEKYISFDFGSLSKYKYYTGIIFSAFTYGTGQPIAKGGRYDGLLSHFGNDKAAVGVGLYIEQIMNALFRKNIAEEKK